MQGNMIRCHLSRYMGERKLKIVDVARATGLHRNTITLLYKETAAVVELEAMDRLCTLFACDVGDMFEQVGQANLPAPEPNLPTGADPKMQKR